jgi:hypothetical protein
MGDTAMIDIGYESANGRTHTSTRPRIPKIDAPATASKATATDFPTNYPMLSIVAAIGVGLLAGIVVKRLWRS